MNILNRSDTTLFDVLDAVEEARRKPRVRVVVKNGKRKHKKNTQRMMDRQKMLAGWNRAAEKLAAAKRKAIEDGLATCHSLLRPLSPQQAGEIAENQRNAMLAKVGGRTTYRSDLTGAEFGKLLVWQRLLSEVNGVPQYLCLCSCGSICHVAANRLIQRRKTHCGCVSKKSRRVRRWRLKKRLAAVGRKRRHARKFRLSMAA
jgi:hypothetical protein